MGLWKDKTRGDWCFSFQFRGKGYGGRGFTTKREAASAREAKRKAARAPAQAPTVMAFSEAATLYLDDAVRKFVTKTYKYKVYVCRCFLKHHGDLPLPSITPRQVADYLNTRCSNNNYNVHRIHLSALFAYAKRRLRVVTVNPCEDIDPMPHSRALKRVPSEDEVMRMIVAADPHNDERDLLIVALQTLGRIDEILRLRWHDVNFEKRGVTLWTRKRKGGAFESDDLPMNQDLFAVLWRRWQARVQDEYVFWNEKAKEGKGDRFQHRSHVLPAICRRAGIAPIGKARHKLWRGRNKGAFVEEDVFYGWHSLRHFMASFLVDKMKESKKTAQLMLRHRSQETTEIYLHSIGESQRAAMDKIAGIFANPQPEAATIPEAAPSVAP